LSPNQLLAILMADPEEDAWGGCLVVFAFKSKRDPESKQMKGYHECDEF
jgi:hypothetical protein